MHCKIQCHNGLLQLHFFLNYENESHVVGADFLISRKVEDGKVEIPVQAFIQLYKNGLIENNGLQLWSAPANSPFDKVKLTTQDIEVLYVKP